MTRVTLTSGPWRGVRIESSVFPSDPEHYLAALGNGYLVDTEHGSSAYMRPGFVQPASATMSTSTNPGQGVYSHIALDGTLYNFIFRNGKVWRWSTDLASAPVDVTPANIVQGVGKFVFATSLADEMIVNDGVNKPWRATNLGSTPITGTVIEQRTPSNVLSRGSTDTAVANTAFTFTYRAGGSLGTQATQAANATGTALGALGQIAANTWGVILVELSSTPAFVFTAAFNAGAGYASEALAIAALPARTATRHYVGYLTVQADAGFVWIAGTDALAGGTTGNQAQTTNYYAGEGAAWSAFGPPVVYAGSLFFVCQQVAVTYARTTITWSEPNEPGVGYQQTDYDNAWTLTQTSAEPIYALAPTNSVLYYARAVSWGGIAGAPGVSFRSTATHDAVGGNVGCTAPQTVVVFRETVYFADASGRPWRFRQGGRPEPLWKQMAGSGTGGVEIYGASVTAYVSSSFWAALNPTLNLYLLWFTGDSASPSAGFAFDAETGTWFGSWSLPAPMDAGGWVRNASGTVHLCGLASASGGVGRVWYLALPTADKRADDAAGTPTAFAFGTTTAFMGQHKQVRYTADKVRVTCLSGGITPTLEGFIVGTAGSSTTLPAVTPKAWPFGIGGSAAWGAQASGRALKVGISAQNTQATHRIDRIEVDAGVGGSSVDDY